MPRKNKAQPVTGSDPKWLMRLEKQLQEQQKQNKRNR